MNRPCISLLITDLDNTIYDWVTAFVPAFYGMVQVAAPLIGVSEDELLDDLQVVHRAHGSAEHPFALLETRVVREAFGHISRSKLVEMLDPAFHEFNRLRKRNLRLYDGVYDTLEQLQRLQIPLVAYTDARVVNALFRLRLLDIKEFFTRLYAPAASDKTLEQSEQADDFVRLLPPGDRKPHPETLLDICLQCEVLPSSALYVGDSLVRDIYMAKQAGLYSAWAKFGTQYDKALWPRLVRVTHWTDADVERERTLRSEAQGTEADCVLDRFSDLMRCFEFRDVVTN
jgi:phosphoglycolate phosphatase-like HAD superfamily hydrolase